MTNIAFSDNGFFWSSYDEGADVLYINFKKPSHATDSELTDDDIIMRYEDETLIGITILHASKRWSRIPSYFCKQSIKKYAQ